MSGPAAKLVLFDLDGVLIDSRPNMEAAWAAVLDATGADVPFARYFAEIGREFRDILGRIGMARHADVAERTFRMASMKNLELIGFYPGVAETLVALGEAGVAMGIVTSKDTLRTNAILAMLPVDFATVQTPDGRCRGKPAPDHLLKALAEARTDPADALYVGDMASDYEAARRGGVAYVHADWGYGPPPPDTARLARIADLPAFLDVETP